MENSTGIVVGVLVGIAVGIGGVDAYLEYRRRQAVPVSLYLEKDDQRTATASTTISLKDADGNIVIQPVTMKKDGDYWTVDTLKLRELRGNYIFTIITTSNDGISENKDIPVTLPNYIGMVVPNGQLYDNKNGIEIRWM